MRIQQIIVKNLFGVFNHKINLNKDDRITIIIGPNGFGKTILLSMLDSLFQERFERFRNIPFDQFSVVFDDETSLSLEKALEQPSPDTTDEIPKLELTLKYKNIEGAEETYQIPRVKIDGYDTQSLTSLVRYIEMEIPELERTGADSWHYMQTGQLLSLEDVIDRFSERLPISAPAQKRPEWLENIIDSIHVRFIETQRLLNFPSQRFSRGYRSRDPMRPAVINDSEALVSEIQKTLAEYASLSQSLDRTFPTRLVKAEDHSELTIDALRSDLSELEAKRSRFINTGLLNKEEEIDFMTLGGIDDEKNRNVLSVYIEDVKQKLGILDKLGGKIDLFVNTINKKFLYKGMSISKEEGFVFTTDEGRKLFPSGLSSGEQHEVVLLFELLFKEEPNSLIIIDDPELSLHIEWQEQFLSDLLEITKLSNFDVLIATHSPSIIYDRWDLTARLEGPPIETTT